MGDLMCVIPGPKTVLRTEDAGVRWCFGCRAHLPHADVLLGDRDLTSYYEPVWVRRCSRCKQNRTHFPRAAW